MRLSTEYPFLSLKCVTISSRFSSSFLHTLAFYDALLFRVESSKKLSFYFFGCKMKQRMLPFKKCNKRDCESDELIAETFLLRENKFFLEFYVKKANKSFFIPF